MPGPSRSKIRIDLSETQIAARAYQRWIGRGCPMSDGADDWFAARTELEAELAVAARSAPRRSGASGAKAKAARAAM